MNQQWRAFRKVDLSRVEKAWNDLHQPLKGYRFLNDTLEKVLRAPDLESAVTILQLAWNSDPGNSGIKADFPEGYPYVTGECVAIQFYRNYVDLTSGGELNEVQVLAISLNVTDKEMSQIRAEMKRLGTEDLDLYVRSAIQLRSQALILCNRDDYDLVLKHRSGAEMIVNLLPPRQ